MASWRIGSVTSVEHTAADLVTCTVALDDAEITAVGYPGMLADVVVGDRVVVNMTGLDLALGTGGHGFLLWNLDGRDVPRPGTGHIVKMRYTPWQTEVPAVEAPESDHHEILAEAASLTGAPVVVCGLHSQVAPAAAGIKAAIKDARVGYLMTDGAGLPLAWSDLVRSLRGAGLIDITATCGHAFGGDLEAVNAFSGMLALRHAGECDALVVAMGPGVVGTGTRFGFTAIEQGPLLDAATALGGHSIAALRISFADARDRHRGVSHHSLTALSVAARERCTVAVPTLERDAAEMVRAQLVDAGLAGRHELVEGDGSPGISELRRRGVIVTSMGRSLGETPELFAAAAAAGALAAHTLERMASWGPSA